MKPLSKLIRERGFDRYQGGLRSRFEAYRLKYGLTYRQPSDDAAMRLDFESSLQHGRVTVWESGACLLEVIEIATGESVMREHHQFANEREFFDTYPKLVILMREALGFPGARTA